MDQHELELLNKYAATDPELKSLWEDHVLYEKQVEKLEGKTQLMAILDRLKKQG